METITESSSYPWPISRPLGLRVCSPCSYVIYTSFLSRSSQNSISATPTQSTLYDQLLVLHPDTVIALNHEVSPVPISLL